MRVSVHDRERFIKTAGVLGMSVNQFANHAIGIICDLIESDPDKLPHTKNIEIVRVGQFMKKTELSNWKNKKK
jgi:hypothetical protein